MKIYVFFCFIFLLYFPLNGALVRETGNIIKEIEIRKRVIFKKNTEKYREFSKDNRQGKYSVTYTHAPFVHIELGSNLRSMGAVFPRIAQVVVLAIEQTICATAYKRVTHSHKYFSHVVSKMCK